MASRTLRKLNTTGYEKVQKALFDHGVSVHKVNKGFKSMSKIINELSKNKQQVWNKEEGKQLFSDY